MLVNIFVLTLFSTQVWATNMATNILKQQLRETKASHCSHDSNATSTSELFLDIEVDNQLNTEVSCQYQCRNQSKKEMNLALNFKPTDIKLRPGDGTSADWDSKLNTNHYTNVLWASLASFLKIWSNDSCLQYAISQCGELSNIEESKANKIKSGKWSYDFSVNCDGKLEVLSPFDELAQADTSYNLSAFKIHRSYTPQVLIGKIVDANNKDCKQIITGQLCFGDCVRADNKNPRMVELLQSDSLEYVTKDTIQVCADNLIKSFAGKNYSKNIKAQICEKFYWDTIYSSKVTGHSCQAARGTLDCDTIF